MPEVLAPGLQLLGITAPSLAKRSKRFPEAVGVEVRKAGRREGLFEDPPDWVGVTPAFSAKAGRPKLPIWAAFDVGSRKEWIVRAPEQVAFEVSDPLDNNAPDLLL